MEDLVDTDKVDYVLILCDNLYQDKANNRRGGVGTETLIMTKEVYKNSKQEKIIPIVWERDDKGKCFLPTYLQNREYIDLSNEETFFNEFIKLLRTIKGKPKYERPPLGKNPTSLEGNPLFTTNRFSLMNFKSSIKNNPEFINDECREFFDKYLIDLYNIPFEKTNYREVEVVTNSLIEHLESYYTLRDCLIDFINFITQSSYLKYLDYEIITDFLEKLKQYSKTCHSDCNCASEIIFSNIIIYEIFLYFITYTLKNKNYQLTRDLIYNPYYFRDINHEYQDEPSFFVEFNNYSKLYEQLRYYSPNKKWGNLSIGHIVLENSHVSITQEEIIDADYILFYCSLMNKEIFDRTWYPSLYPFKKNEKIDLLRRLSKKSFFEKVKTIFNVNTLDEFIEKANIPYSTYQQYQLPYNLKFPKSITKSIKFENICKY